MHTSVSAGHRKQRLALTSRRLQGCAVGLLITITMALAGCGSVLQVTRATPPLPAKSLENCQNDKNHSCDLPGVPFYTVGYRCLHTTVWLQPVYAATLVVTASDGKYIPPITKFFGRKEFYNPTTQQALNGAKAASKSPIEDYKPIMDAFSNLKDIDPLAFDTTKILVPGSLEGQEVLLATNSIAPERYVDANTVLYYNVKKPWSGTANAEIDLNAEGILSKASGQVQDNTLATILSALPISDLIKGASGFGAMAALQIAPATMNNKTTYKLDLQIQTTIYKHTHSKVDSTEKPPCSSVATLVGADGKIDFNFTVEDATAPPTPPTKPTTPTDKPKDPVPPS
jgi:hypothetical protein